MKKISKNFFWINTNPFDVFISKSTYIEMCNEIGKENLNVELLTGYRLEPFLASQKKYMSVKSFSSINIPFFFRIVLLSKIFIYLLRNDRVLYYDSAVAGRNPARTRRDHG